MKRNSFPTTAVAVAVVALLMTSGNGMSATAVACVCPDGKVTIEVATSCSCCYAEREDDHSVGLAWGSGNPSCDDCVDVPFRAPPLKNDHLRLTIVSVGSRHPVAPAVRACQTGEGRFSPPGRCHRPDQTLLSSVVFLT